MKRIFIIFLIFISAILLNKNSVFAVTYKWTQIQDCSATSQVCCSGTTPTETCSGSTCQCCSTSPPSTPPPPTPSPVTPPSGGNWHAYKAGSIYIAYQGLVPCGKKVCVDAAVDAKENPILNSDKNPPCPSNNSISCNNSSCSDYKNVPCTFCHFFVMLDGIIDFALINIVFPLAILLFVVGGALFIFSAGDPGRVTQGKTIMKGVVIGLVIILGAWLVVNTFFNLIGVAEWTGLRSGWWQINCQ